MPEVLATFRDFDFRGQVGQVWDVVENIDPCFGGLIVAVLVLLGHKMASGNRPLYGFGLRLGVLTFLVHAGWSVVRSGGWEAVPLVTQASRSGLIAGSVLALCWITLPVALFVYRYFRVALAAFVAYCGYSLVTAETIEQDMLPGLALRGLLVAGLAMLVAWILQPAWDVLVPRRRNAAASAPESDGNKETSATREERLSRRELRRWRRLVLMFTRPAGNLLGYSSEGTLRITGELRRRRDKARLTAELTYVMAMPEIAVHFPRDMFESWVNRYLGDHLPPTEVEENSLHLQMILARQQKRQQSATANPSLEELYTWFVDEQKRISEMPLDPNVRNAKLLELQEHFVSMSQRFLGEPTAVVPMVPRSDFNLLPQAKAE